MSFFGMLSPQAKPLSLKKKLIMTTVIYVVGTLHGPSLILTFILLYYRKLTEELRIVPIITLPLFRS